jgi:molybdopterin-containing oxidoreductase family iron-sulfur binding subunit
MSIHSDHEHDHQHDHGDNEKKKAARPKVERDERYWLSLEQWGSDPEFQKLAEQEFLSSPLKEDGKEGGWARREFLKLMGASLALGSAGCLRRPVQKIVPYLKQPEELTLGKANYYTSSWFDGTEAFGMLVKTREGRPIKVEGNPLHPLNKNALSARAQAHLLSMYDPDRITGPIKNILRGDRGNGESVSTKWEDLDKEILEQLKKGDVYILTGHLASPSTRKLVKDFAKSFNAKHVMWEPLAPEEVRKGQQASYGAEIVPNYRFEEAKTIVSIDADFLGTWLTPTRFNRQFAEGRKDIVNMSELVVFDSNYSLTGANADKRFKIKPSQQLDVAMGLLYELIVKKGQSSLAGNPEFKNVLSAYANTSEKLGFKDQNALSKVAESLLKNKGKSIVVAGGINSPDAVALQVAVNTLNSILENDGTTVDYAHPLIGLESSTSDLLNLMALMGEKKVKTLIVHGTNPSYYLGDDFNKALASVQMVISTADRQDETGKRSNFILPDLHVVENWGDVEVLSGVVSIQQPTIRPLYDSRAFQMSLITWGKLTGDASFQPFETYYDYVRNFWKENYFKNAKGNFEEFWYEILQKGVLSTWTEASKLSVRSPKIDLLLKAKPVVKNGFELVVYPTVHLGKGELANIGWLQEMPDVMTKIVWDNYLSLSVATADSMKLHEGYLLDVEVNGVKARLPVHIQPGLHDDVATIALGYGRTAAGKLGNGVGYNSYQFVTFKDQMPVYSAQMIKIDVAGGKYPLACVQGHHSMEGRSIVNEATLNEYIENKSAGLHKHHVFSIWPYHKYDGHKWGMSVDLNVCTGCSACVVACQAENNIPIVGKDYCIQGREMQWIRIDRYYTGDPSDAEVVFQPIMCQHCDNAPCETVCPVLATVHSDEGLNEMVYNRCVGTRYCVNNCPYKVRRFNWFNFRKNMSESEKLALNPDVTVRVRGVMEKCTFCVQRIKAGKDAAKQESRELKDGDIVSACQQSCPTGAIVFGDLNDPNSAVAKAFNSEPRGYALLEEFNAAPSVRYLTKIRNNNEKAIASKAHDTEAKKGEH